ncbi:bestrophin family protein [Runella sp. SP2]|uniref:bestrophin family protein n=1 Tax=Runella sp. SP2 TaxID=2268026 RepID=UPI000F089BE3|nr:bestrophin family ion channel [Runella sp. SP2]AYQ30862.1 hydrogenase [Runella sp. SP2]
MILRKVFNPIAVARYMLTELLVSTLLTVGVFFLYHNQHLEKVVLPFSVAAILGSALAIFLAFRNNNSYSRWWEARTLWGSIINNSRIFARQIIANADNAVAVGKASPQQVDDYKKELIYRQIAFAHALRLHLRRQDSWDEVKHLLSEHEYQHLLQKTNKPNYLLQNQGIRIKEGMRSEILGAFDNISLEPTLAGFNNFQGACERIKNTPLLRQYHFFTKLFMLVFMVILPFSLISDFNKMGIPALMIPVSMLVSFVFGVMGKVGEVNEDPFENRITDVPMTSICNTIERDLKEMLEERNLPAKIEAQNGFLH